MHYIRTTPKMCSRLFPTARGDPQRLVGQEGRLDHHQCTLKPAGHLRQRSPRAAHGLLLELYMLGAVPLGRVVGGMGVVFEGFWGHCLCRMEAPEGKNK